MTRQPRPWGNEYLKRRNLILSQTECELFSHIKGNAWAGWLSRYSDWLRAGPSGIISRWGRDFPPFQTGPGALPASCKMGTGHFLWVEMAGAWGWSPRLHLECRGPRKSSAVPLPTLRSFVAYKKGENLPKTKRDKSGWFFKILIFCWQPF